MLPLVHCSECNVYVEARNVRLTDGTWGYKCTDAGHVFTRQGKPSKQAS